MLQPIEPLKDETSDLTRRLNDLVADMKRLERDAPSYDVSVAVGEALRNLQLIQQDTEELTSSLMLAVDILKRQRDDARMESENAYADGYNEGLTTAQAEADDEQFQLGYELGEKEVAEQIESLEAELNQWREWYNNEVKSA